LATGGYKPGKVQRYEGAVCHSSRIVAGMPGRHLFDSNICDLSVRCDTTNLHLIPPLGPYTPQAQGSPQVLLESSVGNRLRRDRVVPKQKVYNIFVVCSHIVNKFYIKAVARL
jgi:hypothetical protein